MTARVFPPHITTEADALDYLPSWAELFGGTHRDGLQARRSANSLLNVAEFHIDFPSISTVLTVAMDLDSELGAGFYKFDLRRTDGTLPWREDNHTGHEHEHGGRCHRHIGPQENHRVSAPPATLASTAQKVVDTHVSIA